MFSYNMKRSALTRQPKKSLLFNFAKTWENISIEVVVSIKEVNLFKTNLSFLYRADLPKVSIFVKNYSHSPKKQCQHATSLKGDLVDCQSRGFLAIRLHGEFNVEVAVVAHKRLGVRIFFDFSKNSKLVPTFKICIFSRN